MQPAGWHSVEVKSRSARVRAAMGAADSVATVEGWLRDTFPAQCQLDEAGVCNRLDEGTRGKMVRSLSFLMEEPGLSFALTVPTSTPVPQSHQVAW